MTIQALKDIVPIDCFGSKCGIQVNQNIPIVAHPFSFQFKQKEKKFEKSRIYSFLQYVFRSEAFIDDVKKIRKRFKLPPQGLPFDEKLVMGRFQFPQEMNLDPKQKETFLNLMTWLAEKHNLGVISIFRIPLAFIVIYDAIVLPEYYDLCAIQDVKVPDYSKNRYGEVLYSDKTHPIAIRISPDVSQTELIKYIKNNYSKNIHPLQRFYKGKPSMINDIRKRDDQSLGVSDFVWKRKDLPAKTISEELGDELGIHMDLGEIKKIKSLEQKRRK